jgi:hypothetical protein
MEWTKPHLHPRLFYVLPLPLPLPLPLLPLLHCWRHRLRSQRGAF